MKTILGVIIAAAALGVAAPASADTIANFTLDGVTFDDGGTATGGFTLDLTSGTLSNVNITTTSGNPADGYGDTYDDPGSNNFGPFPDIYTNTFTNGTTPEFQFDDFFYIGEGILDIDLAAPLTDASLAGSSSLSITGSESAYFFLCGLEAPGADYCGTRDITGGSLDIGGLAATPLPATLPLFAGGLGIVGFLSRRKKRKQSFAAA